MNLLRTPRARSLALGLWLFWLAAVAAAAGPPAERAYWPTDAWRTAAPRDHGMDPARLAVADRFVRERLPDAFSLLVVKDGYLVYEKYYRWGRPDRLAVVHSVTKSVTSALVGIALEEGRLRSLDQRLGEFFPAQLAFEPDRRKADITLEHLLTMSAGFDWHDWGPQMGAWLASGDWVQGAVAIPLANAPGEKFTYNSAAAHLLSVILARATGESTFDFARRHLFGPLGMRSAFWHQDPQGHHIGGFGLGLSPRDLARFGFLYLNQGRWEDRQVVPAPWVAASTRPRWPVNGFYGPMAYGYLWWVEEVDGCRSYRAWGRRGQFVVVVPELDLVVVVTSATAPLPVPTSIHYSPLFDLVAAAVIRPRPPAPPVTAAELPPEVEAFVAGFNRAVAARDREAIAGFFSERFRHDGTGKRRLLHMLLGTLPYWAHGEVVLTGFEPRGDIARVEGVLRDPYFTAPVFSGNQLVREDGRWKWYGNQRP